jgi:uncharacterized protein (TIGR04255 family)
MRRPVIEADHRIEAGSVRGAFNRLEIMCSRKYSPNREARLLPVPKALRRPQGLPNFRHPPVTEVVLSIQFATLPALRSVHAGLYWQKLRAKYPKTSERGPIPPSFETFGGTPTTPAFQVQALLVPPVPRHWFETDNGEHLVQLQPDRIIHNWRQQNPAMQYPRYETVRRMFVPEVEKLLAVLQREDIGELRPNQCEVTYINTISLPDGANPQQHLNRITPLWTGQTSEAFLPESENAVIQTRYVLKRRDTSYGRVYVSCVPALRATDYSPVVQLEISAKGRPSAETVAAAFELLDEERDVVVQTFAAVTTTEMHKLWERIDVRK